ncbi:hypothetical protein [Deinococcus humi]|uniref:Uncharacterized protein n=1 Tax=Deinococcus humi TaxID=662880 RepID=A0A7W8JW22_9DEIO|nr:hypothetical protein [Deinococcus humi]MBB5364030.1 hypothetical protein [Deinococcus humi]GGO32610.1 hypothetical protein GCM10008949_30400 [Deinococcus humi]
MRRATFLMIVLAIVCLALGGVLESPLLIGAGAGLSLKAWKMADIDELLVMFG